MLTHKQLRYFVDIVDAGSFSLAAERLYIAQSALSRQVKEMETQLQVPLLERGTRQLEMTPAGRSLYADARQILRDLDSLDSHTAFLFDKINFLMDATVGFININQNKIIKIFSVASVAFLPPTLIASVYGMNFDFMPELKWTLGYPWAWGLMITSAIAPFLYFRHRGWLK
eukprot:gene25216-28507_t